MTKYTLRDLCRDYNRYSDDALRCEHMRTTYLMENKDNFEYEEIDETDIANLRTFLKCDILAKMEYLAMVNEVALPDWFRKYEDLRCPIEENDNYKFMAENLSKEAAKKVYTSALEDALDIYKKRGLPWKEWDYTV